MTTILASTRPKPRALGLSILFTDRMGTAACGRQIASAISLVSLTLNLAHYLGYQDAFGADVLCLLSTSCHAVAPFWILVLDRSHHRRSAPEKERVDGMATHCCRVH